MLQVLRGKAASWRTYAAGAAFIAAGCGGSTPGGPSGPPTASVTITIAATGVSPTSVDIALGDRVLFINRDARAHSIASDPHPEHSDCPTINQVGFLAAGEQRETGNFVVARSCGFHDHDNPTDQRLWGTIRTR
jgi:plastocyanin